MKKRFAKISCALLCFAMVASVTACSSNKNGSGANSSKAANQTVTVYSSQVTQNEWPDFIKNVKDKTGITVKGVAEPSNYSDLVPKITAMMSSGDDSFDIAFVDELLGVTFMRAGYLEPLDDVMTADVQKSFSADEIKGICSYQGKIYQVPITSGPMFLYANKKMFADAGLSYPKTGDEFIADAKALTKNGVYGYGASWSKGGQLFNDAIRWMDAYGGDYFDWTNQGSKDGLQAMHDFIYTDKITPTAVLGDSYDALNQKMIDGKYAMMYQWGYAVGVMKDKYGSEFEIIPVPTFKTNKTISSGWQMAINKASKNISAAKEVLKFWVSDEGQTLNLKFDDGTCADANVLTNTDIVKNNVVLTQIGNYMNAGSLIPRPMDAKINEIMDNTETILQDYLSNKISLDDCVSKAQSTINTSLGK